MTTHGGDSAAGLGAALEAAARARGALVRAWREHAGPAPVSRRELARDIGFAHTTLESWENGTRGAGGRSGAGRREAVQRIADRVGGGPALIGLWSAVGTPAGLPARSDWQVNYPSPGEPCWAWIRYPGGCVADLHWGAAVRGRVQVPPGQGGVLVTIPTSVRNPPLEISLTSPGWCDGGHGLVAPEAAGALGARTVAAADIQRAGETAPDGHGFAWLPPAVRDWLGRVADELGVSLELAAPAAADVMTPYDHRPARTSGGGDLVPPAVPWLSERDADGPTKQLLLTAEQAAALREARGFSPKEAAAAASSPTLRALPASGEGPTLGRMVVQRMEAGEALPRAPHGLARLDTVYGADGRLGVERCYDSRRSQPGPRRGRGHADHEVRFPAWWVGPVWLQPVHEPGRDEEVTVRLEWGPWTRSERVLGGALLTTRKAPAAPDEPDLPLVVRLPEGWRLLAGTGLPTSAADVGRGWRPKDLQAAWHVFREASEAVGVALPGPWRRSHGPAERP